MKIDHKKIFILALAYYFVFGLSNVSYFLSVFYSQRGLFSPEQAGLVISIFYIASVFSRPFLARILTFLGFRRLFLLSGVFFLGSSICMAAFSASFWVAVVSRAVLGIASSLFKIGFSTYQAVVFKPSDRGRAYSLIMAGELLPLMTIAPVADWMIHNGFVSHYLTIPVFMCLFAFLVTLAVPEMKEADAKTRGVVVSANPFYGMRDCFESPSFRFAICSIFLFSMTDATASFMAPMTKTFGLMASLFLSSNALVGVCVRLFGSRLLDRFSRGHFAALTTVLMSGALLLASINPTEKTLILGGFIFGAGMGLGFPLHLALVADSVPAVRQPQASAIMWFTIGINFSLVPLLMGWFHDLTGPVFIFRVLAGIAFFGAGSLGFLHAAKKLIRKIYPAKADI